jgi:hypothetical protein
MKTAASSGLSIIFQGPVLGRRTDPDALRFTRNGLASARRWYRGAQLILSTWEEFQGEEFLGGLDYDVLVVSKDPGSARRKDTPPTYHNANRQIVSTRAGLRVADASISVKVRSDAFFIHDRGINYVGKFDAYDERYRIVRDRICVSTRTSINPRRYVPMPYHICDWFFWGRTADLVGLFDVPPFPEPEYTRWYETRPKPEDEIDPGNLSRYMAEDYIWSSFLRKHAPVRHEYYCHCTPEIIEESERYIANNAVLLSDRQAGVLSQKYSSYAAPHLYKSYTHGEWCRMYHDFGGGPPHSAVDVPLMHHCVAYHCYNVLRPAIDAARCISRVGRKWRSGH